MDQPDYKRRSLYQIARDYFDYLGRHLPQQCASDEFYFLPRSEVAVQHLSALDDLSPEKIQDHIRHVQNLVEEIPVLKGTVDLEGEIDNRLLRQSMKSFIREFRDAEVWRSDPTLYIKIPVFATDQALSRGDSQLDQIRADLSTIFRQIPLFLSLGVKNLGTPSEISREVALDMAQDAIHFYHRDIRAFIVQRIGEDKELFENNEKVVKA